MLGPAEARAQLNSRLSLAFERRRLRCGATLDPEQGLATGLSALGRSGHEFGVLSLAPRGENFKFYDREVPAAVFAERVVGELDAKVAPDGSGEDALARQLAWASHLSLPAVVAPISDPPMLARSLLPTLQAPVGPRIWIRVAAGAWEAWNTLRTFADDPVRLGVALELPEGKLVSAEHDRWLAEPVECLIVSSADLPEELLRALFRGGTRTAIVSGSASPAIRHRLAELQREAWMALSDRTRLQGELTGQLVPPIQPLRDNITSRDYEVFEEAVDKHAQYREGITRALQKRRGKKATIMVVGAGRGPLVQAALDAAQAAQVVAQVFAIEKNPNAAVTLRERNRREWGGKVTVIEQDMRRWAHSVECDLLVSELLGGFGDNELSPECLDGAQRFLKHTGISLPGESTSFLAPISSAELYAVVKHGANLEVPYGVTLMHARMLAPPKSCFKFEHPASGIDPENKHNQRHTKLRFEVAQGGILHGFAGTFESTIFEEIKMSIRPGSENGAVNQWAPIFFPLRHPVRIEDGQVVECHFWRRTRPHHVWYEWAVSAPELGPIHNADGRHYTMGF